MVLREWASVIRLYKSCGVSRFLKVAYSPRHGFRYWYLWCSSVVYIGSAWLSAFGADEWVHAGYMLLMLSYIALYYSAEKVLSREFLQEYEQHSLSEHPFIKRRLYLRYALFLSDLTKKYSTKKDVEKLIQFADVVSNEKREFLISQHPVIVPLITAITVLSVGLIQQSETWKQGNGFLFVFIIVYGLLFIALILDLLRGPRRQHIEIKKFLSWAKIDIECVKPNLHPSVIEDYEKKLKDASC